MLEPPTHDRNANVPPTPSNDALITITTEQQHDASDLTSPRPCKRHCTLPYISPSPGSTTTEVHLLVEKKAEAETKAEAGAEFVAEARPEAEATAEAQTATLETATPEVEAAAEAATAQVPDPLTADNLASLPYHSIKIPPRPRIDSYLDSVYVSFSPPA